MSEDKKYRCEICGTTENVLNRQGGAITFLCKVCEKTISRWNYVNAKFKLIWSGVTKEDIAEMKKIAQENHKIKDENTDDSMSVLL